MTIVPFLQGRAFGPPDIQAMSKALEDVCRILSLPEKAKSERELLAKKIVALAQQGESAALLRDRVLREMASGRGGWPPALVHSARQGAL
jgi:ABC-type hemin transport system substrate-binding protein